MKNSTLYYFMMAAIVFMMASCTRDKNTVSISGNVSDGNGERIALMRIAGNNPVLVDTLTLGADGNFQFQPKVEKGGPDFFCLVMGHQTIPVVSDTLQTPIKVKASKDKFGSAYEVEDELNQELKKAVLVGNELRRSILNLSQNRQSNMTSQVFNDSIQSMITSYKQKVLTDYIYKDPASPISYYLLFESVSGLKIFDPMDIKDSRAFGAVANLWNTIYPSSARTEFLVAQTKEAMAMRIQARQEQQKADSILSNTEIKVSNYVDLSLPGVNDSEISLSSINGGGHITLVDFTAYYVSEFSVAHNQVLSNIYNKYKNQGLKIYQICLDGDENFWKVSASNLPWTVVRDPEILFDQNGLVQYSKAAALYNVQNIPTTFVMGRDGTAVARVVDDSKLEAAVAKVL